MDPADLIVEPMWGRPRPAEQLSALFAGGWPAFIDADEQAAAHLPRVREIFPHWEFALLDPGSDELVAAGWAVPVQWDGAVDTLPAGYSDSLARALSDHDAGVVVDTAVVCAVQVRPDRARSGVAVRMLETLVETSVERGLDRVVAPLRPTAKHRHPRVAIEEYAAWTRPDGSAYDGWLRAHLGMGAQLLTTAPASQVFTAPVDTWRHWSGLALPRSGSYLVPDALTPLVVDLAAGVGTLTEPCIWVRHRLP